jgi:phosphoribosyl 1,2-cyclic phosphodiesterase
MKKRNPATKRKIQINGKTYERDTEYFDRNTRCHDCGIENKKGNCHHYGCDMERCPKCKGQLISCACKVEKKFDIGREKIRKFLSENASKGCAACGKKIWK